MPSILDFVPPVTSAGLSVDHVDKDWTNIFNMAFSVLENTGGGTLNIPAGNYQTGPWDLPSNLDLEIQERAFIQFIPDFTLYTPVYTRWEGVDCFAMHPLILGRNKENITLRGAGVVDGGGKEWWDAYRAIRRSGRRQPNKPLEFEFAKLNPGYEHQASGGGGRELQFLRPPLLQFYSCENILVQGITLQNSPFWNTHPVYSNGLTFQGVTFRNPDNAPNTDGLDIDSCTNVLVEDCLFDVGDDCLAIKSGAGDEAIRINRPSSDITVRNCKMLAGHGGIVIGSETAGGIQKVRVHGCHMYNTDRGIRIKTRRGRGGIIKGLIFESIQIEGCKCPVVINSFYRCGADEDNLELFSLDSRPVTKETPVIKKVTIRDVRATGCRAQAGFIAGLPEAPVTELKIENYAYSYAPESELEPASEAAMYAGLPHRDDRGIRMEYVSQPILEEVRELEDSCS